MDESRQAACGTTAGRSKAIRCACSSSGLRCRRRRERASPESQYIPPDAVRGRRSGARDSRTTRPCAQRDPCAGGHQLLPRSPERRRALALRAAARSRRRLARRRRGSAARVGNRRRRGSSRFSRNPKARSKYARKATRLSCSAARSSIRISWCSATTRCTRAARLLRTGKPRSAGSASASTPKAEL